MKIQVGNKYTLRNGVKLIIDEEGHDEFYSADFPSLHWDDTGMCKQNYEYGIIEESNPHLTLVQALRLLLDGKKIQQRSWDKAYLVIENGEIVCKNGSFDNIIESISDNWKEVIEVTFGDLKPGTHFTLAGTRYIKSDIEPYAIHIPHSLVIITSNQVVKL